MMGATSEQEHEAYSDEKSNKRVDIQNFYLGETTVTRKLWNAIMGNYQSESKGENLPIENISWIDCIDFIQRLNNVTGRKFRLPTEKNGSMRHEEEIKAKGINTPVQILLMKLHGMMGTVNITPIPWL